MTAAAATAAQKTRDALAEPFPEEQLGSLKKGKAWLTYVPGAEVIARLNSVLGTENWDVEDAKVWIDEGFPEWVLARVVLTATIEGKVTRKIGYGGQKIKMLNSGDGPVDLGDEFKGAMTDGLKKAATQLGVALDLARKDDALWFEEQKRLEEDGDDSEEHRNDNPATDDQVEEILAWINDDEVNDDAKDDFRVWWKKEVPGKKPDGGNLTFDEAEAALAWIEGG